MRCHVRVVTVRATLLAATCALAACGGDAPPAQSPGAASSMGTEADAAASAPPEPAPTAPLAITTPASSAPPSSSDGASASAQPAANVRPLPKYRFPLPPPKPTTIALTTGGTEKADVELAAGDAAFEAGTLPVAQTHYIAARNAAPKRAAPIVGVARVRIAKVNAPLDYGSAKGNTEIAAASKELRRATTLEPQLGQAHVELGRALLLLGDAAGALDALRKGASLLPDEAEAHSAYGVALLATGNGDEALAALLRAAELDPGSSARHGNLGTVLLMRGRVLDAISEYELQLQLASGDPMAHADLGAALLHSGAKADVERGTRELEAAVKLEPKRASFHSNYGYALQLQGRSFEAITQYREAIRIDDTFAGAWINLATVLAREPKTRGEARAALERARSLDATDPRVNANLDELDELEGKPRDQKTPLAKPTPKPKK